MATWVAEEGYLPSVRQVAAACGLRSPSSARRVLLDLEAAGFIERDPRYPRLAVIHDAGPPAGQRAGSELALCELALCDIEASVQLGRRAAALAPDVGALEHVHAEGLDRILLLRAYTDARDRLHGAGHRLEPGLVAAVARHRASIEDRLALVRSWDDYRCWLLVSETLVGVYLEHLRAVGVVYLLAAYEAESAAGRNRRRRFALDEMRAALAAGAPGPTAFVEAYLGSTAADAADILAALPADLRRSIEPIFATAMAAMLK